MTKALFFQTIEKRLKDLTEEVEEMKNDKELDNACRRAKKNILFGRLIELRSINSIGMHVDYWRYIQLDEKIRAVMDSI